MGGDSSKPKSSSPSSSSAPPSTAASTPRPAPKPTVKHGTVADIHVKVIEAKELRAEPGAEPTARAAVGVEGVEGSFFSTKPVSNTVAPKWDEHFIIPVDTADARITIRVSDSAHSGVSLGQYQIPITDIEPKNEPKEMWVDLQDITEGKIHIQLTYVEAALAKEFEGFGKTKFFADVQAGRQDPNNVDLARDYIVIIDKSGSMGSDNKWRDVGTTLQTLGPWVCGADPDGITLYLFSNTYTKHENIMDKNKVQAIFKKNSPDGSTDLASVLEAAFSEHFGGTRRKTTILCITDGSPDSTDAVIATIKKAANKVKCEEELSLTFIQIGNDSGAHDFLKLLDDKLDTKFDIVDTVTSDEMNGLSFQEFVTKSLYD
ncbi:von Willebrand factor type A [Pelomyxa schiedti]|nr:von Willebrand factor type A [Pelomyxa schiedti]